MAASANCDSVVLGKFHPNCGKAVNLSKDRRIASGYNTYAFCVAFSNDPISIGLKFSVKILQHNSLPVVSLITASFRPQLVRYILCTCIPVRSVPVSRMARGNSTHWLTSCAATSYCY